MSFTIVEISKSKHTLWNEFVTRSPQGTFFHSSTWANIIATLFQKDYSTLLCKKNDQPVAGIIFLRHKKWFWPMITPTPLFPFTAPIFAHPPDRKDRKKIYDELQIATAFGLYFNQNYAYWILDSTADTQDMRAYQWQGAIAQPKYSYLINLQNSDRLMSNYGQSLRKKIRQAEKKGYQVRESQNRFTLPDMVIKSYHRHKLKPLVSAEHLAELMELIGIIPQIRIFDVVKNNQILASRMILLDNKRIYDLLAGSNDSEGLASAFLVHKILDRFSGEFSTFDFFGADHPQIEKFKRGFGGQLIQSFRVISRPKIPLRWLISIYQSYLIKERSI